MLSVAAQPSADWDAFVRARPQASVYLNSGWSLLAREAFGHTPHFIESRDPAGALNGVLPLVHQKSMLFGSFATSVPFFNYGGALADDDAVAVELMARARTLAADLGCRYLELRDARPYPGEWLVRTDKASMILELPPTADALSKALGAKLRSQIKRADREQPSVRMGGLDLVGDFYRVFSENMRDLGTPVYPRRFFETILRRFPNECVILVVDRAGKPAATAFLIINGTRAEIPWASCLADAKPAGFNMRLYWDVLSAVIAKGCTHFDFGRSTVDSGTYKFKKQWGAQPLQLYWHRWERSPDAAGAAKPASEGRIMQYATSVWQKLPLGVANAIGPLVSPSLPW